MPYSLKSIMKKDSDSYEIWKYGNDHLMTYICALDYVCLLPKSPNLFSPYLGHFVLQVFIVMFHQIESF